MGKSFIPAHLLKNHIVNGLPMPWIVAQSKNGHCELRESTWHMADLMTVWVPDDDGPPDFGKYDEEMTRQCIARQRCHVCERADPKMLICSPAAPKSTLVNGVPRYLVSTPWVCAECLAYSCLTCHPLKKAIDENRGHVFFGRIESHCVATYWKPVDPGDPIPPPGKLVISSFKIDIGEPNQRVKSLSAWAAHEGEILARKMCIPKDL